ncbi:MAG: HAD-IIA family hydrolase [Clostridiales bacterium]|nr:HAD-IIA family hydrolase [Clostridiales bacterium]
MQDYLGKNADVLDAKKLYLFDMDGTIYRENELFDGVIELLKKIQCKGGYYAFITNNPSKSVKDYIKKLNRLGIKDVKKENFFTSTQASIMIFKEKFGKQLIYAQGTKSFIKELKANGLNVTQKYTPKAVAVLVAFDPELTGKKLRNTCEILTKCNIPYYATNPDWVCPVEFGSVPDCGSMCVGIEYATGKKPVFIGKPQPAMIFELMKKFKKTKEETVVIGDRLYTDIASGVNAGVDTICVLSGEASLQDVENSDVKPTFVFESVKDLN